MTIVIPMAMMPRSDTWRTTFSRLVTPKKYLLAIEKKMNRIRRARNTPVSRTFNALRTNPCRVPLPRPAPGAPPPCSSV